MGAIRYSELFTTSVLERNDDGYTYEEDIGFFVNFGGALYEQLYVNNNGNVTFTVQLATYTPFNLLTTEIPIIAPFFGDVDTRYLGSSEVTYGQAIIDGRNVFGVNWINVAHYIQNYSSYDLYSNKFNSFQLMLIDRSDINIGDFDIEFNYDQIEWELGCASFDNSTSIYDTCEGVASVSDGYPARVGWSNGVDFYYELFGSGIAGAFLDGGIASLTTGSANSGVPGRYIFAVRSGEVLNIFWEEKQKAIEYSYIYGAVE